MGPSIEQILVASILPSNFDIDHIDWSNITQEQLVCKQLNACVTNFLHSTSHEDICKARIRKPKKSRHSSSAGTGRPVGPTGQTSSSRATSLTCDLGICKDSSQASSLPESTPSNDEVDLCLMAKKKKKKKAKKEKNQKIELLKFNHASLVCKYDSLAKDYTCATKSLPYVASLEKANEVLVAQLEKLTSEHMALQATHKELECSHEKLVESYAILDIAHEVVITLVKYIQPLTHMLMLTKVPFAMQRKCRARRVGVLDRQPA
uniref:Uncharacterized protein n=1 Tax=Setaria italica TaxID=4555 RepID=K4ALT4_SETIT